MNNLKGKNPIEIPSLKFKRKRDLFNNRVESLIEIPKEIKSKYTHSIFNHELSIPICLSKTKSTKIPIQNNITPTFNPIPLDSMSIKERFYSDINQEIMVVKDEIDEIVTELEFFSRERRKKKMIKLMEKIAENIEDSLIDVEELTDYYILGNKVCNIENEYIEKQRKKYINNQRFCEYTNRLLLDDDECFNKKGSENEDKQKNFPLVFKTQKTSKD